MKIREHLNEIFGFGKKKPSKKDLELIKKSSLYFKLPPDEVNFVDSQIILRTDGKEEWWVILIEYDGYYYGRSIDNRIHKSFNLKKAKKWIRDQKFID